MSKTLTKTERKEERLNLYSELRKRFNVEKGVRIKFSKKKNWFLATKERLAGRLIERYLRTRKDCLISEIYRLPELRVLWPNNEKREYAVKYLVMLFIAMHKVSPKCNGRHLKGTGKVVSMKILSWNTRVGQSRMKVG